MSYTITLADGKKIEGLILNGNNFASKEHIDETLLENNMSPMTISDGTTIISYEHGKLVHQQEGSGEWLLLFAEDAAEPEPQHSLDERVAALERGSEDMSSAMNTILEVYEND